MIFAIVRAIETQDIVGIYTASDITELRQLVDETATPSKCEYTTAEMGGIATIRQFEQEDTSWRPTAGLRDILQADQPQWAPLDPMMESPGSQLDALLATEAGREIIARAFEQSASITLASEAA